MYLFHVELISFILTTELLSIFMTILIIILAHDIVVRVILIIKKASFQHYSDPTDPISEKHQKSENTGVQSRNQRSVT